MTIELSPLQSQDVPVLRDLEKECFGVHWTPTNFFSELENPRCYYTVARVDGAIRGYLGYWQILEEAHITSVGVTSAFRKQKLAQRMMCHMLDECRDKNVNWITLEVKASNVAAQKLYEKFGFKVMGRRKNYYQVDKQDALVMWTEDISTPEYQGQLDIMKQEILIAK